MSRHQHHKYSILVYLLLANAITWLGWLPALIIGAEKGYIMPNFDTYNTLFESGFVNAQHRWLALAFTFGVYGPLIGAFVATWMDGGKAGLKDLLQRMVKWRLNARWYLIVLGITFVLSALPVTLFALAGGFTPGSMSVTYILFALVVQVMTSGLGEEPGWRGFLLPRLQARHRDENAIWIMGLIWAIWHYPLVIVQMITNVQNVTLPQVIVMIIMSLAGMTMSQIGLSYMYTWLYNRTGSVFLMMVFHALSNVFSMWLLTFLAEPQAVTLFVALMPWAFVIVMQKIMGKDQFPGSPAETGAQ